MAKNHNKKTGKLSKPKYRPQFLDAKEAIKESLVKHKGKIEIDDDPEIAIEVIDGEIKEHKPIEQALVAEHMFRKTIEESITVGIAGFDANWNQIYVNRVFSEMVGWTQSELMGLSYPQPYWLSENNSVINDKIRERIEAIDTLESFEYRFQRKDGQSFWGLVHSNVLADSSGDSIGRLISVANIDAQKNAESVMRQLSTKLIGAQERERKQIAQDLHDSIGGRLAGIKYGLEKVVSKRSLKNGLVHTAIQDIVAVVRSTLEETQRITKELHPSIIDDLGLISAVRGYCREFGQLYPGIEVHLRIHLDDTQVPESLKILVYRVLQEALNNVAKHSEANNVSIYLRNEVDRLELSVEDDGIGFDIKALSIKSSPSSGLGLDGMRERAELFGGEFVLDPVIGNGVRIRAIWPLRPFDR
jgi:PAS domain S-box-containing protein